MVSRRARATFENHLKQLITQFPTCNLVNNVDLSVVKWAEPDSNRRPFGYQPNAPAVLSYRPTMQRQSLMLCWLIRI
jgi:hypothetical protein